MTVLFGGGEDTEISLLAGDVVTTAGTFRSGYARCALHMPAFATGAQHLFSGALKDYLDAQSSGDKDFWYGFRFKGGGGFLSGQIGLQFFDASKEFLRLTGGSTANSIKLMTSADGFTTPVDYPSSQISQPTSPTEYTFRIKIHPTNGQIQWWINGGLWFQTPLGDTASLCSGSPSKVFFSCPNSNGDAYYSEIIATSADDPRVGMDLVTLAYTADGANTGWTGGVATINEVTENQSTVLSAAASLLESSFIATDLPTLASGQSVRAVINSGKWRTTAGAPQSVRGYLRIGGSNYYATAQPAAAVASPLQFIWQLSPVTGIAFTETAVNAAEFGMASVA